MHLSLLSALNAERAGRRAAILVTDTGTGEARLVRESEASSDPLADDLAKRLRAGKSGALEVDGRSLFLNVQMPPIRLVVIGAVHISQALAPMAKRLDLDVTVVDPRTAARSAFRAVRSERCILSPPLEGEGRRVWRQRETAGRGDTVAA